MAKSRRWRIHRGIDYRVPLARLHCPMTYSNQLCRRRVKKESLTMKLHYIGMITQNQHQ